MQACFRDEGAWDIQGKRRPSKSTTHLDPLIIRFIECTVFTISSGTPYLLSILVLKFKIAFYYLLMCLKHCCMYSKQCTP